MKLKPCPFCGAPAERGPRDDYETADGDPTYWIGCVVCNFWRMEADTAKNRKKLIEWWNRRKP